MLLWRWVLSTAGAASGRPRARPPLYPRAAPPRLCSLSLNCVCARALRPAARPHRALPPAPHWSGSPLQCFHGFSGVTLCCCMFEFARCVHVAMLTRHPQSHQRLWPLPQPHAPIQAASRQHAVLALGAADLDGRPLHARDLAVGGWGCGSVPRAPVQQQRAHTPAAECTPCLPSLGAPTSFSCASSMRATTSPLRQSRKWTAAPHAAAMKPSGPHASCE